MTTPFNAVSWVLPDGSEDERPEKFTVNLYFANNGTLAQQLSDLAADTTSAKLNVVPGMNYTVTVVAQNQDGNTPSDSYDFVTPPGRK